MARNRLADRTDRNLLRELIRSPGTTTLALAEATGLARNTVRARLVRYDEDGTLRSFQRRIDPGALGYQLSAYVVTSVTQRKLDRVGESLAAIPEVVEVLGLSGITDLLIRVVARDADDLYRIAGRILDVDGVKRTTTGLVMREMVPYRVEQLL
ncbi:DNA-binding Lrp family transcriptional regulator [Microbacterium sp. W4I4]|uniref:Lrp/AsnC family transcriptional regulator n=1 Tax=Microbacterium sp. W4I4 TaxID=3042295 RepID=UPI00278496F1|nr:Lrp/AsnC family transcriptional regulator [Microbacterium sp. W4I4]MDQ0615630.1 DNA-binding Lrp family transcriptional regulator [Microbacterium sp. W4I4]